MDNHGQAWELIRKRQEYLNNLESQAVARKIELDTLYSQIKIATSRRDDLVKVLINDAEKRLATDKYDLVKQKHNLVFEISTLEEKLTSLKTSVFLSWEEHNSLIKITSNLNQETAELQKEARESKRLSKTTIKNLKSEIESIKSEKQTIEDSIVTAEKRLKVVSGDIDKKQDLLGKMKDRLSKMAIEYTRMQRVYSEKKEQNKKELYNSYLKLDRALNQLSDISSTEKAVRQSIAEAHLQLEKKKISKPKFSSLLEL